MTILVSRGKRKLADEDSVVGWQQMTGPGKRKEQASTAQTAT